MPQIFAIYFLFWIVVWIGLGLKFESEEIYNRSWTKAALLGLALGFATGFIFMLLHIIVVSALGLELPR